MPSPPRSNHNNRDGTAYGENMLFGDMHVEWRPLTAGIGKDQYDPSLPPSYANSGFFNDYCMAFFK